MHFVVVLFGHANYLADNARYANYKLENMHGQLYELCKDQHGCRFLQRKLEERDEEAVEMIFNETKDYVVELMTGKTTAESFMVDF